MLAKKYRLPVQTAIGKKGRDIIVELSENCSWVVVFEKFKDNTYQAPITISSGESKVASFNIDDVGRYSIKSDENIILQKNIEGSSLFGWLPNWGWVTYAVIILIAIGLFFIFKTKQTNESISYG